MFAELKMVWFLKKSTPRHNIWCPWSNSVEVKLPSGIFHDIPCDSAAGCRCCFLFSGRSYVYTWYRRMAGEIWQKHLEFYQDGRSISNERGDYCSGHVWRRNAAMHHLPSWLWQSLTYARIVSWCFERKMEDNYPGNSMSENIWFSFPQGLLLYFKFQWVNLFLEKVCQVLSFNNCPKKSDINLCLLKDFTAQQAPLFGLKSKHWKKIHPFGENKHRQAHRLLNHLLFQNIPSSAIVRVVPILQQHLGINYNGPRAKNVTKNHPDSGFIMDSYPPRKKKTAPKEGDTVPSWNNLDSPSANHRRNSGTPRDFTSDSENKAADLFPRHIQKQSHRWYLRI